MILPQKNSAIKDITYLVNGQTVSRSKGGSFNFGYIPSGGVSKTFIVYLGVTGVSKINNIRIFLKSTGSMNFQDAIFGIDVLDYIDPTYIPKNVINGVNQFEDPNSIFNIKIDNGNSLRSKYVYLNVQLNPYTSLKETSIQYGWVFEYDNSTLINTPPVIEEDVVIVDDTLEPPEEEPISVGEPPNGEIWVPQYIRCNNFVITIPDTYPVLKTGKGDKTDHWKWQYFGKDNNNFNVIFSLENFPSSDKGVARISNLTYPTVWFNAIFEADEFKPRDIRGAWSLKFFAEKAPGVTPDNTDPDNSIHFGIFPKKFYIQDLKVGAGSPPNGLIISFTL